MSSMHCSSPGLSRYNRHRMNCGAVILCAVEQLYHDHNKCNLLWIHGVKDVLWWKVLWGVTCSGFAEVKGPEQRSEVHQVQWQRQSPTATVAHLFNVSLDFTDVVGNGPAHISRGPNITHSKRHVNLGPYNSRHQLTCCKQE